jgi:hypothetical protein
MKSQHAGSKFGMLVIASMSLLSLAGLEVSYLNGQSAYAVTSQTLESAVSESEPPPIQIARRFRSVSR